MVPDSHPDLGFLGTFRCRAGTVMARHVIGSPPHQQHQVNPARAARRLGKQLGLTQDQVDQIQPIIADRQQQIESIRADSTLMPRDRRMKMRSVMEDSRNKIEALLTDQENQQYEQMLQNRREHREQPQAQ